jgi:hypothetical protein
MTIGEDLIEVLLDPGGQGGSAEDLYHLVIKPNGVTLTERGVRCDPPLGGWAFWPADVRVAVRPGPGVWFVELAIPLASLGERANEKMWGINFMRFSPAGGESASWSGTPRYYYDPRNLGWMLLPDRAQ